MCYSIPGKIISISDNIALIDYFGEKKEALVDVEDIKAGDYVFAQGGVIVQRLQEYEAVSLLEGWKELFFKLQETDSRLSEQEIPSKQADSEILRILNKAEDGYELTREEMLSILRCKGEEEFSLICNAANRIRHRIHKNASCVHGIIEFSNICKNDCAYCGIRKENKEIERYRMEIDEIVETVVSGVNNYGFKAFVLQSGEDGFFTTERLVEIVSRIRERVGVLIILSVGEREIESYKKLYDAGARGVLIRFETSNTNLYSKIHTTLHYDNRLKILKGVKDIGYLIATGSLIGLPGQSEEDILNDILLARSLNTEMYSFGPFIPHQHTPLASARVTDIDTMLKVIAVTRLVTQDGNILVTSAVESLFGREAVRKALMAGGNSMMINLTPEKYRRLYSIYPGKGEGGGNIRGKITETMSLLHSLGRAPMDIGI